MRIVLTVAASKYTGAAAVADHWRRALAEAGTEVSLLYRPGRNLDVRLAGCAWAHGVLAKERSPTALVTNIRALRRLTADAKVVICHLPHDHTLCLLAGVHRRCRLVRAFRNSGHLRRDPWHRALAGRLSAAILAHRSMAPRLERLVPGLAWTAEPVPLEDRFKPGGDGPGWRRRLGIPEHAPVVGAVGKLARGRGFELALDAAAGLGGDARLVVVGHGESQPALERRAEVLGIARRVHWAGYQEGPLPDLYAAMDVVLFAGAGSDHGHRAISEAQGCARPVVAVDLPGVAELIADDVTGRIVAAEPAAVAGALRELLAEPAKAAAIAGAGSRAVEARRLGPAGARLAGFLERLG